MESFRFHDVGVEKANAVAKHRTIQRIGSLFRLMEVLVFLIALSRCSTHLLSSLKLSGEYFRGVSLITPRSVFVVGNAIVVALFFISGHFSGNEAERATDFYDEYVEKCHHRSQAEAKRASDHSCDKVMSRTQSARLQAVERRRDLRRSMSEKSGRAEEEMSSEEFRRTVEAFIARQQKSLREEEEFSAVVSFQP